MTNLGTIDIEKINESFKQLILNSIKQKTDIYKEFLDKKKQFKMKDMLTQDKPNYNIFNIDGKKFLYPIGNKRFNVFYNNDDNIYELLVSVGEIYEYRFINKNDEHEISKFAFRQSFAQNPDGLLFYGSNY